MDQSGIAKLANAFDINVVFARRLLDLVDDTNDNKNVTELIANRPKPFVKWVGGKRQLLTQFRQLNLYPPTSFDPTTNCYFEPFVGGGAVFFDLLPKNAVLSDMNKELVITYKVIRDNLEELINALKQHVYNKNHFLEIRAKNPDDLSDIEVASRFIYLNHTCFNGMYRVNSRGEFNVPFGKYSNPIICDETNLRHVSEALQSVDIKWQDYKSVLHEAKRGDFVYFDPPYYPVSKTASFTSYVKNGFLEKEQIELRDTYVKLHKMGCYVMLSNSDTDFTNELYSNLDGIKITKISARRTINSNAAKRGKVSEILVTNYKNGL